MLTALNTATLKLIVDQSAVDIDLKRILGQLIVALSTYSPATAGQVVGLAADTLVGATETITIVNGLITAIATT